MGKTKLDLTTMLINLPLFQQLQDVEIARLVQGTREIHVRREQILFQKGDAVTGVYVVGYGQIKLVVPSAQGNEKVLKIVGPGQSFGEAVMFLGKPYVVSAQALTDALLLHISKEVIFAAIDRDSAFARKMLASLSMRLHELIQDVEAYSLRSGTQRLIGFLIRQVGVGAATGRPVEFDLPASKNIIASRLNFTPETLSRILHNLMETGLITVKGRRITVHDVEQLRRFDQ